MICCITGHRPKGFSFLREDGDIKYMAYRKILNREIDRLISEGYLTFITGMAEGADIDFAEVVISKRDDINDIFLEAAIPYPFSTAKNSSFKSKNRERILSKCDHVHIVSPYYHKGCMQKRNMYMVDKSDVILAIWNGVRSGGTWNTIKYAQTVGKPIIYIMLNEI